MIKQQAEVENRLGSWYEKYFPMVLRRCRRLLGNEDDAADAAQDVFERVLTQKPNSQMQFPSSFLYTIATNVCLNKLRRKKTMRKLFGVQVNSNGDDVLLAQLLQCVDSGFEIVDARLFIETLFKTASCTTRAMCFMHFGDGMTLKEVADAFNMSISGVRKRLNTFAKNARVSAGLLKEDCDEK
jgi:RNA polymerase sigma-70 factor (ECF subfamily)